MIKCKYNFALNISFYIFKLNKYNVIYVYNINLGLL
jgi:hypothetical protein